VDVVCLSSADRQLLSARFAEHGNSHRRMASALEEAGAGEALERLTALRRVERRFAIDLGSLCHRYERRNDPAVHPIERMVLSYVACRRLSADGSEELWVLVDRVREVRELIEGGPSGRPRHEAAGGAGSAQGR
jgi:hypothetical protein